MVVEKFRQLIDRYRMFGPGERVVVGVSGGPDSVCLLHVLHRLSGEYQLQLHVAHLNHRFRGREAEEDARYVRGLAEKWGLPVTVEAFDVPAYMRERNLSAQEAARQVRYAFLAEVATKTGAHRIAVGHNADDQVETVTMNWLRGAGLTGLRGMLPVAPLRREDFGIEVQGPDVEEAYSVQGEVWNGGGPCTSEKEPAIKLVRPLLTVTRAEIEEYLAREGLKVRRDASNEKAIYLRNRVRQELIPLLEQYNPRFRSATLRASESLADDYDFIQTQVCEAWNRLAKPSRGFVRFDLSGWWDLHVSLQRYLLRSAVTYVAGSVRDFEWEHVEQVCEAISGKPAGTALDLPGGVRFLKEYDEFLIGQGLDLEERLRREAGVPLLLVENLRLVVPGVTNLPGTDWWVRSSIVEEDQARREYLAPSSRWQAFFDLDASGLDITLRRRKRGDSFRPFGMKGSKSLQDFMVDARITRWLRDFIPLVTNAQQILWLVGWRMDERVKITPQTQRILSLEFYLSSKDELATA